MIVLNREPETEWTQFEAQSSEWDTLVHIDQALPIPYNCSYPPLSQPDISVAYKNANAMHAHRSNPRLCLDAYENFLPSSVYCVAQVKAVADLSCLSWTFRCRPSCPHLGQIHPVPRHAHPHYRLAHSSLSSFS